MGYVNFKDQIGVENAEFQNEIDSGTPPQPDSFQTTQSISNTLTDSTLTSTPGIVLLINFIDCFLI